MQSVEGKNYESDYKLYNHDVAKNPLNDLSRKITL